MAAGRTHFTPKPPQHGLGGRHRPREPWEYGNPHGGPLDVADAIHWVGYAAPYIIGVFFIPALGILARLLFGSSEMWLWLGAVIVAVIGVVLTYATWDEARPRKYWTRLRATITIGWLFASVVATLILSDPINYDMQLDPDGAWWSLPPRWWGIEIGIAIVLAIWWTIGGLPAVKGDGTDHAQGSNALLEALGLGQSTTRGPVREDGGRRVIPLKLKGVTIDSVRQSLGLLAVTMGVGRTALSTIEDPKNAANPDLVVLPEDPLEKMSDPPPPSRPGGSIEEPLLVGIRQNTHREETTRMIPGHGGNHVLVQGKTGSGKSNMWLQEVYEMCTRIDVVLFHSDTRKLGQTFPDVAPAFCRVCRTPGDAKKLVNAFVRPDGIVAYRSAQLGAQRLPYWTPNAVDHYGNPMPAIGVSFEEASALADLLGKPFREMVETLRSVGCFGYFSVQRASANIVDSDSRAQFGEGCSHAVMRDEDAALILSDDTLEGGASPQIWGSKLPKYAGYHYRECGPEEEHVIPARHWDWDKHRDRLRGHISEFASRMAWGRGAQYLDQGSIEAMGDAWDHLMSGADYALTQGWTRTPAGGWVPPTAPPIPTPPPTVTATVQSVPAAALPKPTPSSITDDDSDDESTEEMEGELDDVREEVAADLAIMEDDELDNDDTEVPYTDEEHPELPPELDFTFEAGTPLPDGSFLDYRGRLLAAADVFDALTGADPVTGQGGRARTIRTGVIVDRWLETEGIGHQQRPAMNRILWKLKGEGYVEDPGRGSWTIDPKAGAWLRKHADELTAEAGTDDEAEDE